MPTNRPQASTTFDDILKYVVWGTLILLILFFIFDEFLPYLIAAALCIAGLVGIFLYKRHYDRTKGASTVAYRAAQASSTDPVPPPPTSLNWVEHEVYRDSLKKPAAAPQKLYELEERSRLEHALIVAPTGHGKSQLMEFQLLKDLEHPDPPPLIVIDSKPDMVNRLSRLDLFHPDHGRLKDRLIIVDPRDAPALNMFDVPQADEETSNEIISQLAYFLGSLLEGDTSKTMAALYQPLARLMLTIDGANLNTLLKAIDNIHEFAAEITKLDDPDLQHFLLYELGDKKGMFAKGTKDAVKRRIHGLIQASISFRRMFNARTNQLNLVDALNTKKIVLVSTDAPFLKDLSPIFGKYIISRVISAALVANRTPAYLYIDEAKPYTDEKIEELLRTLRSYKLGAVLAYQTFPDLPPSLRTVLSANTTIKFIGGGDEEAANNFARQIRAPADFIYNQTVDSHDPPRFTRFALHVKNKMQTAIPYQIPIGSLDKLPNMDNLAYLRMRIENRKRLADRPPKSEPPPRPRDKNVSSD